MLQALAWFTRGGLWSVLHSTSWYPVCACVVGTLGASRLLACIVLTFSVAINHYVLGRWWECGSGHWRNLLGFCLVLWLCVRVIARAVRIIVCCLLFVIGMARLWVMLCSSKSYGIVGCLSCDVSW